MSAVSDPSQPQAPEEPKINTRVFADEPLLLRLDLTTFAFFSSLKDEESRRLMEIVARAANLDMANRPATKKELKKYKKPGYSDNTRNVEIKYRAKEEQLLKSGTFDPVWGLKWLLSYVVLVDSSVFLTNSALRLCEITEAWLDALAKDIDEISDSISELKQVLENAQIELANIQLLSNELPGKFNSACSLLFGGDLKQMHIDPYLPKWVAALQDHDSSASAEPATSDLISLAEAQDCVDGIVDLKSACTCCGSFDIRIHKLAPVGDLGLVSVCVYKFDRQAMKDLEELTLLFEHDLTVHMRENMVVEATLYKLANGQHFIDSVTMVWPSYTPLDYALLVDWVNDAELVVGSSTSNTSVQMFSRAADAAANANQAIFIECNSGSLRDAIANAQFDTSGLDRILVKYVKSADMLRALLASWHCDLTTQLTQEDFLVWSDVNESQACIPDYLFINGIDAIASASRYSIRKQRDFDSC
ncbi:hypothetical protein EV183_001101 [Coemansia sp. RSA 2336]|nr:hypothetical protein EV183_001101 [Coemansia sp. RSA 2336]